MRKLKYLFIILLAINFFYCLSGVLFAPIKSMDALGIWLLKAKAIYLEEGFPRTLLLSEDYSYSHQQYPLFLPFLFSLVYRVYGGINEKAVLIFYPLIYAITLFLAYRVFRRQSGPLKALVFTYIYSMLGPLLAQGGRVLAGNADIVLTLISWVIVYLLTARNKNTATPYLITLLVMIASQVKLEGVFLTSFLLFLALPKMKKLGLVFASLVPFLTWRAIGQNLGIPMDFGPSLPAFGEFFQRAAMIAAGTVKEMLNLRNWYLFWPIFFLALNLPGKFSLMTKKTIIPALGLVIFAHFGLYLFFGFSGLDTAGWVASSADRLMLQLSPYFFYLFFQKAEKLDFSNCLA